MKGHNPYTIPAGAELDELVGNAIFGSPDSQPFSTDEKLADKVRAKLIALYGHQVVVGKTRLASRKFFARFESGPSTSTEVLAESYPLAICRLAVLISSTHRAKAK